MESYSKIHIHFIGIGGVSMSALAKYCLMCGAKVSGSDAANSELLTSLKIAGAEVYLKMDAKHVKNADIVVYSSAIKRGNPELDFAFDQNKVLYERHEFLGKVSKDFSNVAAIAGTHGKTTVTAMLAYILKSAEKSFVANIGGNAAGMGNYVSCGEGSELLLTEACEYKKSLLSLNPTLGVVTNIECDHPDCYEDIESLTAVFYQFLSQCESYIAGADAMNRLKSYVSNADMNIYKNRDVCEYVNSRQFGGEDYAVYGCGNEYVCTDVNVYKCGESYCQEGTFKINGEKAGILGISLQGCYNMQNAVFAVSAAHLLGVNAAKACEAIGSFKGVSRRFEDVGNYSGTKIIFDYAHHPTEIKCALDVAMGYGKVLAVFQPHTYSRTAKYFDQFINAFAYADGLLIMPTYAARETPNDGVGGDRLAAKLCKTYPEKQVDYINTNSLTADTVKSVCADYDVVIFLGAGDIYDLKKYFT